MAFSRAQLRQHFAAVNAREPSAAELDALDEGAGRLGPMRQRAAGLVGTPYKWGGTTKEGIDCSAFISNVWGVDRQTTDTLGKVAKPVGREELEPGDALNLTTGKDPRGFGHVRMFDGWANPEKTQMHVYESSTATGGVVRRVIPYDAAYTPMRLASSDTAERRAEPIAVQTQAAGITTPSRPDAPIDPLRAYARQAAQKAGIDPDQFERQIQQESGFNPTARSGAGAQGIAQIVPKYHPGVDPSDPRASLDYAAKWMADLTKQYGGDQRQALAHYNGGGGAVQRMNAGTPYAETTQYLNAINRPAAPAGRQQFLEANAPGESGPTTSTSGLQQVEATLNALGVGGTGTRPPGATTAVPSSDSNPYGTPASADASTSTGLPAWMQALQQQDRYSRHIASQMEAPTPLAPFQLPPLGLPGFRPSRPFQLPGGR